MSSITNNTQVASGHYGHYDEALAEKMRARSQNSNRTFTNSARTFNFTNNPTMPDIVELSEQYQNMRDAANATGDDGTSGPITLGRVDGIKIQKREFEEREVYKYMQPVSHAEEMRIRFAGVDRALGLEAGSTFNKFYGDMITGKADIDWERQAALDSKRFIDDYDLNTKDFAQAQQQINADREDINAELEDLLSEAGLSSAQQKKLSISLNADGSFSVSGLDDEANQIAESALSSSGDLTTRMLKTSAMQSSINLGYIKETEESLAIEMTLVDIYLKEQVGYGVDDLDIFRLHSDKTDPALKELLDNDQLLDRQIYRYGERKYHGFENTFSATWNLK